MKIGSLFAGYGGLEMGLQSVLGGHVAWHSEIDPAASRVLARHWPGVPNHGDIKAADWDKAMKTSPYFQQGYVETSNVNVVEELVSMIQTQRAYEMNSKVITTTDEMLRSTTNLR